MHPAVSEAAIVGIEDEVVGERPLAFVVVSKQDMATTEYGSLLLELERHVQSQLDESHWLRQKVCFVKELPKSQAGKVLKKRLREAVLRYHLVGMKLGIPLDIEL